jgi:opacity protein-like surface antigen
MKQTIIFMGLFLCVFFVKAQDRTTLGINYQYAIPMGKLKSDFVDGASPRGIGLDLLYTVNPKLKVGAAVSYQDFYQKRERNTYQLEDGSTLSAVVTNSLQNSTLMAKALYLPTPEKRLQPFFSAGVGANMAQVNQTLGVFDNLNDVKFGFAAQAGAGLQYGLGEKQRTHLTAGAMYNYLPFNKHNIGGLSNLAFGVGARFTLKQGNNRRGSNNDDWDSGRRRPRHYGW